MADGIEFRMFTEPFQRAMEERRKRIPRAAMWAVREAGRVTRRAARSKAPLLKDKTVASHRQLQRRRRQGEDVSGAYGKPVPGLLKGSIKASRAVREGPGDVSLVIAPRGARVHLYAGKQEERFHYMQAADEAARAQFPRIAQHAFDRVWEHG